MVTDPERLLKKPSSRVALLLLRAGKAERPSEATLRRGAKAAAAAAVLGAATTGAHAAATAAGVKLSAPSGASLGVGALAKWFGIGALAGVVAAPVVRSVVSASTAGYAPVPALSTTASAASQRPTTTQRGSSEIERAADPNQPDVPNVAAIPTNAGPASSLAADPGRAEVLARTESALLAAEVAFVERGRSAFQRGAFDEAIRLLTPYEERFQKPQLLTEVLFLRMESFSRSGNVSQAKSLAARVITRGLAGPQAARAREVLGTEP